MASAAARYNLLAQSLSSSTALQIPAELSNLSQSDIDLLDAVIQRANPAASSFVALFKAYNAVLTERGLDPHEVVFYDKLLKLSMLKGANWGDRWNSVKRHQAQAILHPTPPDSGSELESPVNHSTPKRVSTRRPLSVLRPPPLSFAAHNWVDSARSEQSECQHFTASTSTTPPSYRSDLPARHTTAQHNAKAQWTNSKSQITFTDASKASAAAARQVVAQARARRGSAIDEDAAWNKIKQAHDEKDAEMFRNDKVLERCWYVWKIGLQWVKDREEQVQSAHHKHMLRIHFLRWKERRVYQLTLYDRVTSISNTRSLRNTVSFWRAKCARRKQEAWRRDMRTKMALVKKRVDDQLCRQTWETWRQAHLLRVADSHFFMTFTSKTLMQWRSKVYALHNLMTRADEYRVHRMHRSQEKTWNSWKRSFRLRETGNYVRKRTNAGTLRRFIQVWKNRRLDNDVADSFYDQMLQRHMIEKWKIKRSRILTLEKRAQKHISRQDDLLLRAVGRVWKARERGRLLERVKSARVLKDTLQLWRNRVNGYQQMRDLALQFYSRPVASSAVAAFKKWQLATGSHLNAQTYAASYYDMQAKDKYLLAWRKTLSEHYQQARMARDFCRKMIKQRTLIAWQEKLGESRREKALQEWTSRLRGRVFYLWVHKARQQQQCKMAEEVISYTTSLRIMRNALTRWTNKVIEIKLRELEVIQQNQTNLLEASFKKWKTACIRHVEALNLLESYQLVKDEEKTRRMFYQWLSAARASRYKRVSLNEKETEVKLVLLGNAWEKWRDKFSDERLRFVERAINIRRQQNILFRAFGIWKSRTNSLPAIRLRATHIKIKAWNIWRATIPRALQAKTARDVDGHATLSKALNKWSRAYKKRIDLKAIARARYLRLPTTSPRRPLRSAPTRPPISNRSDEEDDDDDEDDNDIPGPSHSQTRPNSTSTPPLFARIPPYKNSLSSLLARPSAPKSIRSAASPTRESVREHSPSRSALVGRFTPSYIKRDQRSPVRWTPKPPSEPAGDVETIWSRPPSESPSVNEPSKSRLWLELKDVRARGRSRTTTSRPS